MVIRSLTTCIFDFAMFTPIFDLLKKATPNSLFFGLAIRSFVHVDYSKTAGEMQAKNTQERRASGLRRGCGTRDMKRKKKRQPTGRLSRLAELTRR